MAVVLLRLFASKHQLDLEEAEGVEEVLLKAYSVNNSKLLPCLEIREEAAWGRWVGVWHNPGVYLSLLYK